MIALYALGLVLLWLLLTWLLLRFGWRVLARERNRVTSGKVLVGIAIIAWLGASFWYGGGRKVYYDWRVRQMCAVDGGVKVYERVVLPADKFNQWGQPNFFKPNKKEYALGPEYVFEWKIYSIRSGNPSLRSSHTQVFRRSNGKLLGETIDYSRGGGDLPGPWQPSAFTCPEGAGQVSLLTSIFVRNDKE